MSNVRRFQRRTTSGEVVMTEHPVVGWLLFWLVLFPVVFVLLVFFLLCLAEWVGI
jgi:hypothetical protein